VEIKIRKVRVEDSERVAEICRNGWLDTVDDRLSETYKIKNVGFWYTPEKVEQDIRKGQYSFVAVADNIVAGVIGGGMISSRDNEIFVFYMARNYRYMGIGKRLLHVFTEHFKKKGASVQWASVQEGNSPGMPFYESNGFYFQSVKETDTGTGEVQRSLRMKRELE